MKYYIITGASRGLGEALVTKLMVKGNHIICVSRSKNTDLIQEAQENHIDIDYYQYDLSITEGIEELTERMFERINKADAESISLINNAGVVSPIKPIHLCSGAEMEASIKINTLAPMILTSQFMKHTDDWEVEKKVINISSGAGKKPYFGWSSYCSSKAAIDIFTRCAGVEQNGYKYPVKVISFSPGIIDTDMQGEIRSSNKENFQEIERFIAFHKDGKLKSAEDVADKVIKLLCEKEIENGALIDICDIN